MSTNYNPVTNFNSNPFSVVMSNFDSDSCYTNYGNSEPSSSTLYTFIPEFVILETGYDVLPIYSGAFTFS